MAQDCQLHYYQILLLQVHFLIYKLTAPTIEAIITVIATVENSGVTTISNSTVSFSIGKKFTPNTYTIFSKPNIYSQKHLWGNPRQFYSLYGPSIQTEDNNLVSILRTISF